MKSGREVKQHIKWCLKQDRGIKLTEPNDNLCMEYLRKSKSALNILEASIERKEIDWIATTAYYARYFAFYALLQKCGIKSEIHDCSISAMKYLFVDEEIIEESLHIEMLNAKELRIDTQYYVAADVDIDKIKSESKKAVDFVLKIEESIDKIDEDKRNLLREKLKIEYISRPKQGSNPC